MSVRAVLCTITNKPSALALHMNIALQALFFSTSRAYITKLVLVGAAYAVVLFLSYYLVPPGTGASIFWPVSALSLSLLVLYGLEYWPALILTHFLMGFLVRGTPPPLAAAVAFSNTVEALLGAYLLARVGFNPMFSRVRDSLSLILTATTSTLLNASLIVMSIYFISGTAPESSLLVNLWIGHTVSILALAPFIIRWLSRPMFYKTSREVIEGVALFGTIAVLCFLMFWTPYGSVGSISLIYVLIIPLIWATMRTGPRGVTLSLALIGLIGATGILFGFGPLTPGSQALFFFQILVGTLCIIFLLFSSIVDERLQAVRDLEEYIAKLSVTMEKVRIEDRAKTEFLAILAHELRNPLSPILSSLELLKLQGPSAATPELIEVMDSHVQTVARLLDDLLDVSRISRKKFQLQKEHVTLQDALKRSLQTVETFLNARGHTVSLTLPQEDIWLDADPVRLEQIFVNLLNNAGKYTDPNGEIRLMCNSVEGGVRVCVADNGIGISAEHMDSIFEPFSSPESSRKPGGLGIGLSLTRKLVELHRGTITATSEGRGKGSTFEVWLPLGETRLPSQKSTRRFGVRRPQATPSGSGERRRVFVVDDNEAAANGLCALLRHSGHDVEVAYDGPSALEKIEVFNPDVVILDIGLPGMDGYEVARILRGRYGVSLVLIALTGYGQEDDRRRTKEAGFAFHLTKPVSITDVESVLTKLGKYN